MADPALSGGSASALSPLPLSGGRRRRSGKKLRLVKKKTVRRMLAKKGLKMRGGAEPETMDEVLPEGGRRRSHRRSVRRSHRRRGLFGKLF